MPYRPKPDLLALAADIADLKQQLIQVTAALARLAAGDRRVSLTIVEWCARHGISESQYHKLRRMGHAPRALKIGSAGLRISIEADREWTAAREAEAAAKQEAAE